MNRLLWSFAALVLVALVCGGAKIVSGFGSSSNHDPRLVGAWKGRWFGNAHRGTKADVLLFADGTGKTLGSPIRWETRDDVLYMESKGKRGVEYASAPYLLGRRGSAVAFDGGTQTKVPLGMTKI